MPLRRLPDADGTVVRTRLFGRVTDDELLAYYERMLEDDFPRPLREFVDGTDVEEMAITSGGQQRLAQRLMTQEDVLRGGRVAMLAIADATYGMFRMWELKRAAMDYEVRVFRDRAEAETWLLGQGPGAASEAAGA